VTLTNSGAAIHNMSQSGPDGELGTDDDIVSDPSTIRGGEEGEIEIGFDDPGTYLYQCDFHPDVMTGEITVE
jgi:plastocyanin